MAEITQPVAWGDRFSKPVLIGTNLASLGVESADRCEVPGVGPCAEGNP